MGYILSYTQPTTYIVLNIWDISLSQIRFKIILYVLGEI